MKSSGPQHSSPAFDGRFMVYCQRLKLFIPEDFQTESLLKVLRVMKQLWWDAWQKMPATFIWRKCLKRWRSAFPCNSCYTDENHITKGVKPEWEMENRNQPSHSQRYPVLWGHPVHSIPLLHLMEGSWSAVRGWSYSYRKTSRQIHCWSYFGWWSSYDEAFGGRCQPHISGMRCHRFSQADLRTCLHSQHAVQAGPFPGNLCPLYSVINVNNLNIILPTNHNIVSASKDGVW